jgi:hypothetical protein
MLSNSGVAYSVLETNLSVMAKAMAVTLVSGARRRTHQSKPIIEARMTERSTVFHARSP